MSYAISFVSEYFPCEIHPCFNDKWEKQVVCMGGTAIALKPCVQSYLVFEEILIDYAKWLSIDFFSGDESLAYVKGVSYCDDNEEIQRIWIGENHILFYDTVTFELKKTIHL